RRRHAMGRAGLQARRLRGLTRGDGLHRRHVRLPAGHPADQWGGEDDPRGSVPDSELRIACPHPEDECPHTRTGPPPKAGEGVFKRPLLIPAKKNPSIVGTPEGLRRGLPLVWKTRGVVAGCYFTLAPTLASHCVVMTCL